MKVAEQRKPAQIAVAVIIALIGPYRVCHQIPVKRERKRPRTYADDLGRVPVRHHTESGSLSEQKRMRLHARRQRALDVIDQLPMFMVTEAGRLAQDERAGLKQEQTAVCGCRKLDVKAR